MNHAVAILMAFLLPQENNAAEEMLKKVEEKLSKAESVHVSFKTSFEQQKPGREKISGVLSGSVLLEKGGKARLEVEGDVGGPYSVAIVSDGKSVSFVGKDVPARSLPSSTPPTLERDALLTLSRLGGESAVAEIRRQLILRD